MAFSYLFKKQQGEEGNISHYEAVSAVLAGNFGTGNISGMAVALTTGGPGALVWMWIMTFLGSAIQYASCFLGVKYRQKNSAGEFVGGPMYYLTAGNRFRGIGVVFALIVIVAAFACGNFVQINSMALPLKNIGFSPLLAGTLLAIFVGIVILGGANRVAHVSSAVVPIMAILYLGAAIFILGLHSEKILPAFGLMFKSAISGHALSGGVAGFALMKALRTGFDRAIFATDAGTGTVPILQSGAKTKDPVIDGVVSLVAPFLVMIVCTVTALVLIVTGVYQAGFQSTNMVIQAFQGEIGPLIGPAIVIIALVLFGYTTTLAWATCLERAIEYLGGAKWVKPFLLLYIAAIPLGTILQVEFVWVLADVSLTGMMILNLIGVTRLSTEVIQENRKFFGAPQPTPLVD